MTAMQNDASLRPKWLALPQGFTTKRPKATRLASQRSNWLLFMRAIDDAQVLIGDRQLEHVLGKIHSHDGKRTISMQLGLPSDCTVPRTT